MKLSAKLILLFLLAGVLIVASVMLFSLREHELLRQTTLNNISREAAVLSNHIDDHLSERYNDTRLFPLVLDHVGKEQLAFIASGKRLNYHLNEFIRTYQVYRRMMIFDTRGYLLASNTQNKHGKTLASLSVNAERIRLSHWFQKALSGQTITPNHPDSIYVEGPVRGAISGEPQSYDLLFAKLIRDDSGDVAGIWVNLIDFTVIESMVKKSYLLQAEQNQIPGAEILLLDKAGNVIVDISPVNALYTRYPGHHIELSGNLVKSGFEDAKRAIAGLSGADVFVDKASGQRIVSGYFPSKGTDNYPGLGWSVLIRTPAEKALVLSGYLTQSTWLSVFILSIWCLVAFTVITLLKPIVQISGAVRHLASGNTRIPALALNRDDEIGQTAKAVNQVRDMLHDHSQQLILSQARLQEVDIPYQAFYAMTTGLSVIDMADEEMPMIYVNPAFESLTGYRAADLLGKSLRFLQLSEDDQSACEQVKTDMQHGRSCSVTVKSFKRCGTFFMNYMRLDPIFNEAGSVSHYLVLHTDITEQARQQERDRIELENEIERRTREFKDSENRLRAVLNTALDGIVVLNEDKMIQDVNYAFEVIFGRSKKALEGKQLSELIVPIIGEGDTEEESHDGWVEQYLFTGYRNRGPVKVVGVHQSGRMFPVEISVGETWLDNHQAFVCVARDVTTQEENWRREQALKHELTEREIVYRAAFSNAAIGIARLSAEGRFLEVNQRMCKDFGFTEAEFLQLSFTDITFSEDLPLGLAMVEELKQGKRQEFTLEKRYVKKDGEILWGTVSVSLVRNPDDSPKYLIAVIEDISERKVFEEELKQSKVQRDELLKGRTLASEAGGICNWSINLNSGALKWDDNMYALYGVNRQEPLTYDVWKATLHPDDIDMVESVFRNCVDKLIPFNCEYRIINQKTARTHWVKGAADVIAGEDDLPEMMFGINLDITEERQAQMRLEKETFAAKQASEAKSRFLATMSHEIRTPMNGVIGMIDLLRDTSLTQDQKRMVSTVRDSAFSLLEIINDILDFSKIEAGQMELEYTETSLLPLIEKTTEALWVNAADKGVNIYIYYDFLTPSLLLLDSVRIRQILLNLLGNSIKFTGSENRQGYVIVHARYEAGLLSLQVEDNGVGMSASQIDKLFRPFSQADSSTTRRYGGTGLGLTITKSFVDMMKGTIEVESVEGSGSIFSVHLPVDRPLHVADSLPAYRFSGHSVCLDINDKLLRNACMNVIEQLDFVSISETRHSDQRKDVDLVIVTDVIPDDQIKTDLPHLCLTRDPVCPQGFMSLSAYVVGAHPLKPGEFIFGLAVLCGLESPDIEWDFSAANESQEVAVPDKVQAVAQGTLILCAEDQPVNQLVISRQLEKLGYAYEMAENGKEALDLWQSGRFGLVLTDCHMPEMDGYELSSEIRQIEEQEGRERTVIIALTANAMAGESEHCLKAGMDDYITKPVELTTLKKILSLRMKSKSLKKSPEHIPKDASGRSQISGIDYQQLSSVIGTDDQTLMRAVLAMFWESVSKDLSALESALTEQDSEQIRSKAHGAKGASASSGAIELSRKFKQVENNCNNLEIVNSLVNEIKSDMEQMQMSLKSDGII